ALAVQAELEVELRDRPNRIAAESLRVRGAAVVAASLDEALAFADELAPEHLELLVREPAAALPRVQRAAAVFVGAHAPVPVAVPLHLNESPSDLPQDLKAELSERIARSDWSKYPIVDGARLADDLARVFRVDPAGVLVGNGSNELLQLTLLACVEPGDAVV